MRIIPKQISEKVSSKSDSYLLIKDDKGQLYSVWDMTLFNYFFEGTPVDIVVETKGKFKNIVGVNQAKIVNPSDPDWEAIRKEKAEGLSKGASFNKSVDVAIAIYQKGEIDVKDIVPMVKKVFEELKKINQNGN